MNNRLLGLLPAILILGIAWGLRLYTAANFNYNWDEGFSNWIVQLPFADMLEATARDVHPPLYYQVLRTTQSVAGQSEFATRFPSALFGLLSVALTYGLARTIAGQRVGLLAMLLMAVARSNIDNSQLARNYILATALATAALWAAIRFWRDTRRWRAGLIYALSTAAALWAFYLTIVLPLATNLAFLFVWRRAGWSRPLLKRWAALQILAALLFLPWAVYALQFMGDQSAGESVSASALVQFYFVTLTTGIPAFWEQYRLLVLAVVLVIAVGAFLLFRRQCLARHSVDELALLILTVAVPLFVVFLLTRPFHDFGRPLAGRYLPLLASGFYTLAAWGIIEISRKQRLAAFAGAGIVLSGAFIGLSTDYRSRVLRDDFDSLGQMLAAHRRTDDAVVLHNDWLWPHLYAAYDGERIDFPHLEQFDRPYVNDLLEPIWASHEAVWLVETSLSVVNDPTRAAIDWLSERALVAERWTFNENTLSLYVRTPERAATLHDLAPQFTPLLNMPANPAGLLGAQLSRNEYPIGDHLHLALYWAEDARIEDFSVLLQGAEVRSFSIDAPQRAARGVTRQFISLPLDAGTPEGDYRVAAVLPETEPLSLGRVRIVDFAPDASSSESNIQQRLDWRFGTSTQLLGYNLSPAEMRPGAEVEVTLFWRADEPLAERYKVLVYVLGDFNPASGNPLWGQQDSEPLNWLLPTTQWPPGVILEDRYTFTLSQDAPPGEYQLGVAMYGLADSQRLLIEDADGAFLGDTAIITPVRVS